MNVAVEHILAGLRRAVGGAMSNAPDCPLLAFAKELARAPRYVRELRRWFDGELADAQQVVDELHMTAWLRIRSGASAAEIHALYTPVARLNRGRDALRRQRCERKYIDRFEFERGTGNRHTSARKSEELHVAGKHHT